MGEGVTFSDDDCGSEFGMYVPSVMTKAQACITGACADVVTCFKGLSSDVPACGG